MIMVLKYLVKSSKWNDGLIELDALTENAMHVNLYRSNGPSKHYWELEE